MALFDPEQLKTFLRYAAEDDFDADAATLSEKVVAGWLTGATKRTRADLEAAAIGDAPQVFSWALELGGIAYENPTSMQDDQVGAGRTTWRDRRAQILESAREWAADQGPAGTTATGPLPRGSFPKAQPWPDPPRVRVTGC
jgi:hypothetical protein